MRFFLSLKCCLNPPPPLFHRGDEAEGSQGKEVSERQWVKAITAAEEESDVVGK